jgi:DNA-binding NtrC family response regulator
MNILIVDDDELWKRLVSIWLIRAGHTTATCSNAYSAISRLQKEEFDLVITDLAMPEMSGLKLHDYIEEKYDVKIIVMSGYDQKIMQNCNFKNTFFKNNGEKALLKLIENI